MRCRLGSFSPQPGSTFNARRMKDPAYARAITRAREDMLRVRLSMPSTGEPDASETQPELLKVLGPEHPDRIWAGAVRAQMEAMRRKGVLLRLLACEYEEGPDGFVTIAACAPGMRHDVFPDDPVQIGFAVMRREGRSVRAWPRLLREVCDNGSIVCFAQFEPHEGEVGMADAIRRFLTPATYETAIEVLRETRDVRVHDPGEFLDEFDRIHDLALLRRDHAVAIEDRFDDDGDESLYGLFNAVTATARDIEDWRERLTLEETAGRIAWLRRPSGWREGTRALPIE